MEPKAQDESPVAPTTPDSVMSGSRDAPSNQKGKAPSSSLPSCSAWAMYRRAIKERPIATKAITSATVSALGELLATAFKARFMSPPPRSPVASLPDGVSRELRSYAGGTQGGVGAGAAGAGPSLMRRTAAFAIFGLIVNGPVFHWWYNMLERTSARLRKSGEAPGGTQDVAFKLAMDRLVATPPYLMLTLVSLRLLQGLGLVRATRETRQLYLGALMKNWKVWTLAQLINFKLVPVEFRPLFGNIVAVWWNIYLSLLTADK